MDDEDFERLLKICRLRLSEADKPQIKKDIEEVLDYFNVLDDVGMEGEMAYQPVSIEGRMREDSVEDFKNIRGMLKNTKTYRFYVVGPKI